MNQKYRESEKVVTKSATRKASSYQSATSRKTLGGEPVGRNTRRRKQNKLVDGLSVAVLVLLGVSLFLGFSKLGVEKKLEQEQALAKGLNGELEQLQNQVEKLPMGAFSSDSVKADYTYSELFPDLVVEPIAPPALAEDKKMVALTFDDGPSKHTAEILDKLKEAEVNATFFVTTNELSAYADVLKRAVLEGHTIGIHTSSHKYEEIYASVDAYLTDFYDVWTKVTEITGQKPSIFRFPGGSVNHYNRGIYQQLIAEMTRRGFVYYDWNVASQDATTKPNEEQMMYQINHQINQENIIHPVVLMHDTKQVTAGCIDKIITAYKNAGYEFITLEKRQSCYFPYQS